MHRRGHQHARLRYGVQLLANVRRIERLPIAERQAALQRQQHCHLKAVHVLRRHGADQRERAPVAQAEMVDGRAHAAHQRAPRLAMRHWRARRAGREQHRHDLRGVDLRHVDGRGVGIQRIGITKARQVDGAGRRVVQAEHVRRECRKLTHHLRRLHGRQQADLAGHQRRAQADGKAVAVCAGIEYVGAGRQHWGQRHHIGQERTCRDGRAVTPGE
ncbi:xanthomonadin biosynthesis protein 2, partial [Corchorus olitorius]